MEDFSKFQTGEMDAATANGSEVYTATRMLLILLCTGAVFVAAVVGFLITST